MLGGSRFMKSDSGGNVCIHFNQADGPLDGRLDGRLFDEGTSSSAPLTRENLSIIEGRALR
jgi:hypothetical protein